RVQAEQRLVELRLTAQMGCGDQPTVEVVGPLVVRTGDAPGADAAGQPRPGARCARLPAQARTTVPAYIVEGAQPSLAVAQQNDALAEDIEHAERAGLHQLFLAPDTDPVAAEDPLLLHGEYALGAIPARWQGGLQTGQPRGRLMGAHGSFSRSSLAANPGITVARCLPRGASRRQLRAAGSASSSRAYRRDAPLGRQ